MIIAKKHIQYLIKEETRLLLDLNKIPLLEGAVKSFNDPLQVLQAFAKKLAQRGYDVSDAQELGQGYNGIAYDIGSNRVLKITMDDYEARTANHLKGKSLKHVIPISDVFKFKTSGPHAWYGIIEGKAQPFTQKQEFNMYVKLILSNLSLSVMQQLDNSPWVMPWNEIKARVLENTKPDPEEYSTAREGFKFLEDLKFNILLKELKANDVEYFDVHADNFMMYGGNFVLVDLGGHSKSPGEEPSMLERKSK